MKDTRFTSALTELIEQWKRSPYPSTKVASYFPAYVELFGHLRGMSCVFIETGVLGGGSLFMWREWLGQNARIIGIDLNPEARKWERHGFEIFIGDQGDPEFWRETFSKIGQFDVLLDDGGHQSFQQIVTTYESIKHLRQRAVVAIEDTHTSFMKDFSAHGEHTFLSYAKSATDMLTSRSASLYPNRFDELSSSDLHMQFEHLFSIQFFGSLVAFKIDPELCVPAEIMWNRAGEIASDFRFRGKNSATVQWPDPFNVRVVEVHGGKVRKPTPPGR